MDRIVLGTALSDVLKMKTEELQQRRFEAARPPAPFQYTYIAPFAKG